MFLNYMCGRSFALSPNYSYSSIDKISSGMEYKAHRKNPLVEDPLIFYESMMEIDKMISNSLGLGDLRFSLLGIGRYLSSVSNDSVLRNGLGNQSKFIKEEKYVSDVDQEMKGVTMC